MALLVLINLNFKFLLTVPCLALNKNTPAYCIRGVLHLLFMSAIWTFYFLFLFQYLPPPAIEIRACFICSKNSIVCFLSICFALRFLHSFRIRCWSFVKCFKTSSLSSARIDTIRPKGVSEPIPTRSALNSSHFIPFKSRDRRIPYCD